MLPSMSLPALQTGDLLLFSGRGWSSDVIRWFTGSNWTHVGVIVCLDEAGEPLVFESTLSPESVDLFRGEACSGVTLVPLSRRIADYQGDIVLRRREGAPLGGRQRRLVRRLVQRLYRRPYRHYLWRQLLDAWPGVRRDYRGMFCSELVAELYRRLGWLPRDIRAGGYVPGHFGQDEFLLQEGALSAPLWLKRDRAMPSVGKHEKKSALVVAGR
ncbi:MAG: hypothetical protein ACK4SX_03145 [Alcanivoracaceae bacterium]